MTKRSFIRFLFTFICVFALACVLMPGPAKADTVTYITRSWNGSAVNSTEATRNDVIPFPESQEIAPGWYYVNRNITIDERVCLQGDTHIILCDGCTLDVKGLYIPKGYTLHIYGQSEDSGKIYSHPSGGAGIGGYSGHDNGNIVIYGGTIEVAGYDHCAGIGSNDDKTGGAITIYGGTITAKGGSDGAAIGGGRNCSGGAITIYGGDITANDPTDSDCPENGAGIGGGKSGAGGTITIWGGTITTYSRDGAGIGGGDDGVGGTITIYGGTITSTKVNQGQGARIGGGCDAAPGTITIHGGTITTVGGKGAGIGGGKGNTAGGSVTIDGGVIEASGSYGIGSGQDGSDVAVTLDYTDATRDSISVTASSYNGTVTLEKTFVKNNGELEDPDPVFMPGVVDDNSLLTSITLEAYIPKPRQISVSTVEHGAVTADKTAACAGETVHLTAAPEDGYWLSAAGIYSTDNQLIRYVSVNTGGSDFIMPDQDIIVKAEFRAKKAVSTDVLYPFGGLNPTPHLHGTLTADKAAAGAGETVTLTLATDEGYGLKSGGMKAYARLGSNENQITVTEQADGTWTFIMPDGDYTADVYAEIEWKKAPPAGPAMPYFYIDEACTAQGSVEAGSVPVRTPPLSAQDLYRPSVTQLTLTVTPEEGYVFKGWEVVTVGTDGLPFQDYSLPVEYIGGQYMLEFSTAEYSYIFRIKAVFEEGPTPITLDVQHYNKNGTINTDSTITASPTTAYAGDAVTVTVNLAEGAKLGTYTDYNTHQEKPCPEIYYYSGELNDLGTNLCYIEPVQNGDTYTFTVPEGISQQYPTVYVNAAFEDETYSVTLPDDWDVKIGKVGTDKTGAARGETVTLTATVAGNVTFVPATDLTVSYTDEHGMVQQAVFTPTGTTALGSLLTYTGTFTMPAHDVTVGAVFTQKAYSITMPDLTGVSPRPETTIAVDGFDVSTDHVYRRANAGDAVTLSVISPNNYTDDKLVVRGIWYTLDATGDRYDLALTYDKYLNPSCAFSMPAGSITFHYETGIAYGIRLDTEGAYGTFSLDRSYAFEGETVTITGVPDTSVYAHDWLICTVRTFGLSPNEDVLTTVYNGDGSFTASFIMPGANVIAAPKFQMKNVPHVQYSYAEGTGLTAAVQDTPARYFILDSTMTELTGPWYVVKENVSINTSLTISGNVSLLLMDGVTLTAKGVEIQGTGKLTVFGQVSDTGKLNTTGNGENPGVSLMGGGMLEIHGGRLNATGGKGAAGIGGKYNSAMNGTLVVYGGYVSAKGGHKTYDQEYRDSDGMPSYYTIKAGGAGIGGGACGSGGTVVIYGGEVEAEADMGAGIGAGTNDRYGGDESGGSVTILGGCVTAIPHNMPSWYDYWAIGGGKSNSLTLGGDMIVTVNGQTYTGATAKEKCRSKAVVIISSTAPAVTFRTVSFAAGDEGATGSMSPAYVLSGDIYMLPACGFTGAAGKAFAGWQVGSDAQARMAGDTFTVTADTTVTALWQSIIFGNPDFEIPGSVTVIENNAFEGIAATAVEIPEYCTRIGDRAFKDCGQLTMIRIPADCELGTDVFDGCTLVYVFSTAGSPAEDYCNDPAHGNCVFVKEGN